MALSTKDRNNLKPGDFAVPEGRHLPIHDKVHINMAWDMVDKTKGLSDTQRKTARQRILRKASELGMDTSKWHLQAVSFSAMAIEFPSDDGTHPNKLPFTGILTRLDRPSDKPLMGTGGKRVILPSSVAEAAISSLLGMCVDFSPDFAKHRPRSKIGLITAASVVGDAIEIAGYFYAADFPEEVQTIQDEKEKLGFSFEAQSLMLNLKSDPLIVEACEFTGAAVLYKDKAAYYDTSIAANADKETEMNDEETKQLAGLVSGMAALTESLKTISASTTPEAISAAVDAAVKKTLPIGAASVLPLVKPHAAALRSCAANMQAAGIGCHASAGHAVVLNRMADKMEAEAIMGTVPNSYDGYSSSYAAAHDPQEAIDAAIAKSVKAQGDLLKPVLDAVASMGTQIKDFSVKLTAAASPAANAVARKTLSASDTASLKRIGLEASGDKQFNVTQIDEATRKAGLGSVQSMALKLALKDAGALAAN